MNEPDHPQHHPAREHPGLYVQAGDQPLWLGPGLPLPPARPAQEQPTHNDPEEPRP